MYELAYSSASVYGLAYLSVLAYLLASVTLLVLASPFHTDCYAEKVSYCLLDMVLASWLALTYLSVYQLVLVCELALSLIHI